MLQNLTARLSIAAAILALGAATASGAIVTRTFTVNSADIVDLYSTTFDAPRAACGGSPTQECTFFGGTPPTGRAIAITPTGTGDGTVNLSYESTTGEITQINSMVVNLPSINLVITPSGGGSTTVSVIRGNALPTANDVPFFESGTGTLGRDLDGPGFQTALGQGTVDPDEAPAVGQATIYQHDDSPHPDAPDFAVFSDIVDSCNDVAPANNCGLITLNLLTLDAVRYRVEGRVGCGPTSLVLKAQTANFSIWRVNLTATSNDADCDGDTVANALDNCPDVSNVGQEDGDGDGRGNMCDNCRTLANNGPANNGNVFQGAQADSNDDGFGNRCDGDLGNNGTTNAFDTPLYRAQVGKPSVAPQFNAADINASGAVNAFDTPLYRALIGAPPGPGAGP